MIKTILGLLVVLNLASNSWAQGTVNWSSSSIFMVVQTNESATLFGAPISIPNGGNGGGGNVGNTLGNTKTFYYYTLLYSTDPNATAAPSSLTDFNSKGWTSAGLTATNGPGDNGRLVLQGNGALTAAIVPWAAGTTASVTLVGWSANLGTDWATVLNALNNWPSSAMANEYFGVSAFGSITAGNFNPGPTVFGAGPGQIENPASSPMQLYMLVVPEPGTTTLTIIGVAVLLLRFARSEQRFQ